MAVDINTGFADGDLLRDIRTSLLNPLAVKAESLKGGVESLDRRVKETFKEATPDLPGKRIELTRDNGNKVYVDLAGMFKESSAITIKDEKGTSIKEPESITFSSAVVSTDGSTGAMIDYDWDTLVPTHQEKLSVGKTGVTATHKPKALYFKGSAVEVEHSGDFTTVTIPDQVPLLHAQISTGTEQFIDKLIVDGNVGGSSFNGNTLTIQLPDSGGGGISNQNFKGFFNSLGDIISEVKDPINGMSYAFAKDSKYGAQYYTPYLYVNNGWTELKQDPALLYSNPTSSDTQGVFSIKPDPKITIDSNGQLDLSKLGEETPGHFHGFYDTVGELSAAVPNPIVNKSFGYTKHTNGAWIGRQWRMNQDGTKSWGIMAPISAISLVESSGSSTIPAPVYGFYKNGMIEIDGNGLATIKGAPESSIKIEIGDGEGGVTIGSAKTIQFMSGKSYATLQNDKLFVNHPQRVIEYNSSFEADHNTNGYMGNIFYDKTSRCWMGWGVPEAPGGVDHKWTRIAHPKMSDEVKDLLDRYPSKAPNVTPGVLGDNRRWQITGWSFVEKDDVQLPESFRSVCGGYFFTMIQDIDGDPQIPTQRIQICYADREGGEFFIRRFNPSVSPGSADQGWLPWVRGSITSKDLDAHNQDPAAHKNFHKFYKVCTFDHTMITLKASQYYIKDKDMMLISDSHGLSMDNEDTTTIPYSGKFRFSGRFALAGLEGSGGTNPTCQWILRIYRTRGTTSPQLIYSAAYNHSDRTKPMASMKWESGDIELSYGDKISFYVQPLNDDGWSSYYKDARFLPMQSYFVIQDAGTRTGSRIAETHRRSIGTLQSRQNTGVNVHYSAGSSGLIRVYGTELNVDFKQMTNA